MKATPVRKRTGVFFVVFRKQQSAIPSLRKSGAQKFHANGGGVPDAKFAGYLFVEQGRFPFFTEGNPARIMRPFRGGIAQLGERLHGMQEVSGSIPLTSTTKQRF